MEKEYKQSMNYRAGTQQETIRMKFYIEKLTPLEVVLSSVMQRFLVFLLDKICI